MLYFYLFFLPSEKDMVLQGQKHMLHKFEFEQMFSF